MRSITSRAMMIPIGSAAAKASMKPVANNWIDWMSERMYSSSSNR